MALTKYVKDFILNNYTAMTQKEMAEKLNLYQSQICKYCSDLNIVPVSEKDVDEVKQICARLADIVNNGNGQETKYPYHVNTFKGDAIRCILHAQMAAVKYLTFNK